MGSYEYLQPESVSEALEQKSRWGAKARFMAGGTDVMVLHRAKRLDFEAIISLRRVRGLAQVTLEPANIILGAAVTLKQVLEDQVLRRELPGLVEAAATMGSTQMRNLATVGGNVMSAVSSADTIPPLICLGAQCQLASIRGERRVPMAEMFTGPRATQAGDDEMLLGFVIPRKSEGALTATAFGKLGRRRSLDLAVVNLAVSLTLHDNRSTIMEARVAAGAVGPTPLSLKKTAATMEGETYNQETVEKAVAMSEEEIKPWDDVRASRWYRGEMVRVLLRRTAQAAYARAVEGGRAL